MIIDSHTHVGEIQFEVGKNRVKSLPENTLLLSIEKYKIDFALVSSIEGAEFDSAFRLAPKTMQVSQNDGLKRLLSFVKENESKLRALIWIKPFTEGFNKKFENQITVNRKHISGLKIHPTLSNIKITDRRYYPYLEMAVDLNLPVQVHTENDGRSDVKNVEKIASIFPELKFIMVHMGMNSDNSEAINLIRKTDNIFGDTCVVEHDNVIRAIKECGSEKILFGTDAVVKGLDTYEDYLPLIKRIKETFNASEAANILGLNCIRIFNLPSPLN
jgi:hypothetical protein